MIRSVVVVLAFVMISGTGWARGNGEIISSPDHRSPVDEDSAALSFADRIDGLLAARFDMVDKIAPQPSVTATDPAQIVRRLEALQELSDFAERTIEGLVGASMSVDVRNAMSERLQPILTIHQSKIAAALGLLLQHPLVLEKGWFVISQFGAKADRDAALLVRAAPSDWTMKNDILGRLRALAPKGETTFDAVRLVADSVKSAPE